VDTGREVESHQGVNGLGGRVEDVDQALVGAHLEVLARVLVLVRRLDDAVHVLLCGQRHRARDRRTSTRHRLDDLLRRGVDDLVVVGLEPDADLLSRHGYFVVLSLVNALVPGGPDVRPSDPRGRACRTPADTDVPCSNIPAGLTRPYQNRGPGADGPPGAWPAPRPRFPEDSRTSAPTPSGALHGTTSTVGLASGPPGGRRAASTLDRATRTVCHSGSRPGQSNRGEYPGGDVGQTRAAHTAGTRADAGWGDGRRIGRSSPGDHRNYFPPPPGDPHELRHTARYEQGRLTPHAFMEAGRFPIMVRVRLETSREHVAELARLRDPVGAVEELLWNALDADGGCVVVSLERNDLGGVDRVQIQDDGCGMSAEQCEEYFRPIGSSWKKRAKGTPVRNRALHGKNGRGRVRAFALGSFVRWTSVSETPQGRRQLVIEADRHS